MSVQITPGAGVKVAADQIGSSGTPPQAGDQVQYFKPDLGGAGQSAPLTAGPKTAANSLPIIPAKGTKALSNPTPGTTATLVLAANANRITALLANTGTQTVYFGKDNTVTTSTGIPLPIGASLEDGDTNDAWWGIVASGTGSLAVLEVS